MSFAWSPAVLDQLFRLYIQEGRSAAESARMIGGGLTRNAVLGKAQRMGWKRPKLDPPPDPAVRRSRPESARGRSPPLGRDIPLPPLRQAPLVCTPKVWTERQARECAYPIGEPLRPELQLSCCAPSGPGGYCAAHRALMAMPESRLTDKDVEAIAEIARRAA